MYFQIKRLLWNLIFGLCLSAPVFSKNKAIQCRVLATIDKRPITTLDVVMRFLFLPKLQQVIIPSSAFPQYAPSIFRQLLLERLQLWLAAQHKIEITPQQLEQAYASWMTELKKRNPSLKLNEMDVKSAKEQLKANMSWDYYIEARYGAEFQITPQEILFYKKKWAERPALLKQIRYGEIVIFYTSSSKEAFKEMQSIKSMLDQGNPFPQVASYFSQSESKKNQGVVDWIPEHMLDPELLKILSQAEEGTILGPCVLPNSRSVVCVVLLGRKTQQELGQKCPSDEQIKEILRQERKGVRVQQEIDKLLNGEHYEISESAKEYLSTH